MCHYSHTSNSHIITMNKLSALLCFSFVFYILIISSQISHSRSIVSPKPQPLKFLKVNHTQSVGSCSYTVQITTTCSSPVYTRDQISLSFGDAYGNQVYVPRLDDLRSRTFERCSTDTFTVSGPCTYQVCYLYLYRSGYDGWMPGTVTVFGYYTRSVSFYYNSFIPSGMWYGFNFCHGSASASDS